MRWLGTIAVFAAAGCAQDGAETSDTDVQTPPFDCYVEFKDGGVVDACK